MFNSAGSTLATPHFGPENGVHLITPSMKLGASAQRLASAKVVRSFSGVVYNDNGEVEQTLEFAEVSENGGDIG